MRQLLAILLAIFIALPAQAQAEVILGGNVTPEQIEAAKNTLAAASAKKIELAVDEYQIVIPDKSVTGPILWLPFNAAALDVDYVPANTPYAAKVKLKGEAVATHHRFAAKPYPWALIGGKAPGAATFMLIINGKTATDAPTLLDQLELTIVGNKPKPPDPGPVDPVDPPAPSTDPIVIAAQADIKAGKGTANDVKAYANIYTSYASKITNTTTIVTVNDLYKAMNSEIDNLLGSDIDKTLPSLRRAMAKELDGKIPTNPALKIKDYRDTIAAEFADVAKRLQAVK